MQLKLLPPHPLPTVLFTLAYPAPPSNLPLPASYAALLKLVVEESLLDAEHNILARVDGPLPLGRGSGLSPALAGLGSPAGAGANNGQGSLTPHALDKATWIAAVLSEVVFDLSDGSATAGDGATPAEECEDPLDACPRRVRVHCRYVDGREVSWVWDAPDADDDSAGGDAAACHAALQSVLRDVNESAAAGERERRERERRHTYHERFAFAEARHGACGGFERYDRYPAAPKEKERKRHSAGPGLVPMQRSYSYEEVRDRADKGRRRSLDEEFGRDAEVHVPGHVETKRGKGKKGKGAKEERKEDAEEEGSKKGKHKKRGSLLMSLVALASFISPRNARSRSPPPLPSPRAELEAPTSLSAPSSRSPSPSPPHVVHPQLAIAPHQDPPLSSSDLRRRARATLVDVFRRYVLAKLKTPDALPPRVPLTRVPRRVRSVESDGAVVASRRLRSVNSALTTRSSDFSLSDASMRVHCVSRSPSVGVLRASDILRGADAAALHQQLATGHDDDEEDDEISFGRANEGGYVTWVTRSLLTRVEAEMREMRVVLRSMHALPPTPPRRIPSTSHSVGARMGFSPIEGPLLSSVSVSPPISGFSGVVGEWGTGTGAIVDEPAPFFDGFEDEQLEDVPLTEEPEDDAEDRTSTGTSSSAGSTETDGSSVHTPSEATSFDSACIRAPATPPLAEPERGEYFSGVQEQSSEFEPAPLASSPPRRPVLAKQPPIEHVKTTQPPPLPSQLARDAPPAYRPTLTPLSMGPISRTLTPSPGSALSSPGCSQSSPTPSTLPIAAYTALSGERARLLGILARLASQHAAAQADEKQLLNVLEAKSRRRAWSNRAFMGGAAMRFCALAIPDRRSALATGKVITLEDLDADKAFELEGVQGVKKKKRGSLVVTTAESNIMRLFPVCEEEEDSSEDEDGDRSFLATSPFSDTSTFVGSPISPANTCAESPFFSTALSSPPRAPSQEEEPPREDATLRAVDPPAAPGGGSPDEEALALSSAEDGLHAPLTRHRRTSVPVRARPRTRSMSMGAVTASSSGPLLPAPVTMGLPPPAVPLLGPVSASYPGGLAPAHAPLLPAPGAPYMLHGARSASTADLLCAADAEADKMEFGMLEAQTKVELFDVYSGDEDEEEEEEEGVADAKEDDDAFVLGIDIAGPAELPSFCKRRASAEDGWMPAAHL